MLLLDDNMTNIRELEHTIPGKFNSMKVKSFPTHPRSLSYSKHTFDGKEKRRAFNEEGDNDWKGTVAPGRIGGSVEGG